MKYQCQSCENVMDIPKKQSNGVERKKHACQRCNAITTVERLDYDYEELTDAQREFLRKMNPRVCVNSNNRTTKTIHLKHGTDTLCNHNIDTRVVDIEKYPLGYLDWCQHCLARSRNPKSEYTGDTKRESVEKAMQYAAEKVDNTLTMSKYDELDITPSVWTVKQVFGSWSEAKEECL